ncbi:MAG TPA: NAD(P)/FAD-dependent oxidoreductase [Nitriliruptorales bacterium]|nr:NAD(P)/FAD-dependent oxidoreductase [Nitriliruptorales bacterium]
MAAERVVVVGAGFAGLAAARELAGRPVPVTVVDRHNYHLFQPLLYQVATAGLEPQGIAKSVRGMFHGVGNISFRLANATGVDWDRQKLLVDSGGPLAFDHLIIAAGATSDTLGIEGVREHTYPLKTLDDAVNLRDHILTTFERADVDPSIVDEGALTFVVVGGGPTGVELCGAFVELFDHVLARDFPGVDVGRARIVLVEALPHLLDGYSSRLQDYARSALIDRGVEVLVDTPLEDVSADRVRLAGGAEIATRTVVWAAGVRAQTLADRVGLEQTDGGRIVVGHDLSVPGRSNVYAVGDIAGATDPQGELYPQLAPVAQQQARHVVRQIALRRRGRPTETFRYRDKGTMATVGRDAAVAQFPGGVQLTGVPAWLAWLGLHLILLIGFRNRAVVLVNWLYNYTTYDRAARLIIRGETPPRRTAGEEADRAAALEDETSADPSATS